MLKEVRAKEAVVSDQVPTAKSQEEIESLIATNPEIMKSFAAGDSQGIKDFFEMLWGGEVISISEKLPANLE